MEYKEIEDILSELLQSAFTCRDSAQHLIKRIGEIKATELHKHVKQLEERLGKRN